MWVRAAGLDAPRQGDTLGEAVAGKLEGREMILKRAVLVRRWQAYGPLLFLGALLLYGTWPWLSLPGRTAAPDTIVFSASVSRSVFGGDDIALQVLKEAVCPVLVVPADLA